MGGGGLRALSSTDTPSETFLRDSRTLSFLLFLLSFLFFFPEPLSARDISAEKSQIVDCLLPGKVRKLGMRRKFTTARRPIKTSARECETRGGEYTAFDRASRASSLKVWLDTAKRGSAEAQYYVGEIFEKGFDQPPDYQQAKFWYQQAAEQDYVPAQIAMGLLYEEGRGMAKDLVEAMNWYRRAEGLKSYESSYSAVFDSLKEDLEKKREKLQQFKSVAGETLTVLGGEMNKNQQAILQVQQSISNQRNLMADLRRKLELDDGTTPQAEDDLAAREASLKQQQQMQEQMQQELVENQQEMEKIYLQAKKKAGEQSPPLRIAIGSPTLQSHTRNMPSAEVQAGVLVDIFGSVFPPEELVELRINGEKSVVDQNGLFAHKIEVGQHPLPISITARGLDNQTVKSAFLLQPQQMAQKSQKIDFAEDELKNSEFGTYYALVIGNNNYAGGIGNWPKLATAVNDAKAVAAVLKQRYGVKTTLLTDATRSDMLLALQKMREKLTDDDNLILYYAGHGHLDEENGQGYWIPVDGKGNEFITWISNSTISDQIRAMTARNILIISDSCYSASLTRSAMAGIRSGMSPTRRRAKLRRDIAKPTRMVLAAGGMQPVADSLGNSKHSVFAAALLEVLEQGKGIIAGDTVAVEVGQKVAVKSEQYKRNQVPGYAPLTRGGHQGGEFYFVAR